VHPPEVCPEWENEFGKSQAGLCAGGFAEHDLRRSRRAGKATSVRFQIASNNLYFIL
jgi:hypothetical protein